MFQFFSIIGRFYSSGETILLGGEGWQELVLILHTDL